MMPLGYSALGEEPVGVEEGQQVPPLPGRPAPTLPDHDTHIRRTGDDYGEAFRLCLPQGTAWVARPRTVEGNFLDGMGQIWGEVDGRAADLLERESDPRLTIELLPDWERNWGLPDPCIRTVQSIEQRHELLLLVMTIQGGQSIPFFYSVATLINYSIGIKEYAPFMCGVSRVGDTRPVSPAPFMRPVVQEDIDWADFRWQIGAPEMRFYWSIRPGMVNVSWFRASSGQAGIDPHCRTWVREDVQCLFERWKPAHTAIVFDYSHVRNIGPMYGTP